MTRLIRWPCLIGVLCLTGVLWPVGAAAGEKSRPDMGRIAHAGFKSFSHCTATRLGSGPILTAAHCLPDVAEGEIHLGLGYDRGAYQEMISATGGNYQVVPGRDVAILCRNADGPGLAVSQARAAPAQVTFWGYGRPYVHILNHKTCNVTTSDARYLVLDCAATPGYSGGAVTVGEPPSLVGIVSRASRTRTVVERLSRADVHSVCDQ